MPLTSVQLYTKNLINGLSISTGAGTETLTAYVTPPTVSNLNGPIAVVLGTRLTSRRQAGPRGPGYKHLQWVVDVYLAYLTNANSSTVDTQFPRIVDAIMAQVWSTTIPLFIDTNGNPVAQGTSGASQILNMGEDFELEYPPERTPASLRMLYFGARLGLDLFEAVQA